MVLSSLSTRSYKVTIPIVVLAVGTVVTLYSVREDLRSEPWMSLFVMVVMYGCAAKVLWWPWRLPIADEVQERQGALWIRRGEVEVSVPYSAVREYEYLTIGTNAGMKLMFSEPNDHGGEIGFYLSGDAIDHMQSEFDKHGVGRAK